MKPWLKIIGLGLLGFLQGCSESPTEALMSDYLTRLTRALEVTPSEPPARPPLPNWPGPSQREVPLQAIRLGLLEAYGLRGCTDLLTRVAERNSQLGRVMIPSQRLVYEVRLANTLESCLNQPSTPLDTTTLEELDDLNQQVLTRLAAVYWNFLVSSDVMAGLFSLSGEGLSPDRQLPLVEHQAQLERLLDGMRQLQQQQPPSINEDLEQQLRIFRDQAVVAQLLSALLDANRYLQASNQQLEKRLNEQPLCPRPTPELPRAQISQSVLNHIFIGQVQPWFARLERKAQIWLPAINELLDSPLAPPAIEKYRATWISPDNPETPWRQFLQLNRQHASNWEALLQQCGLRPGIHH